MILKDIPVRVHSPKNRDGLFSVAYFCPMTGRRRRVSVRKSGRFSSKDAALEWGKTHLTGLFSLRSDYVARQRWRLNTKLLRQFDEYSSWRSREYPRSAMQDLSLLSNYAIPYFVSTLRLNDPGSWGEYGYEFISWLESTATTSSGQPLALSSSNRIISNVNQFMKWMRRNKHIAYEKFRAIECLNSRRKPLRKELRVVSDEVFHAVHEKLRLDDSLYADLWYVQGCMGFRVNELIGLAFHWLSDTCPEFIKSEFESKDSKVYGSIYLESQPSRQRIKRELDGSIERVPLKGRPYIGDEYSRTVPITDKRLWEILVSRYDSQLELWELKKFGHEKESYLLFDGAECRTYRKKIARAYREMGLESSGTHILRHTASTRWTALKISERVAELILGHKTQAHQVYVHIVAQVNAERAKALPLLSLLKIVENQD